MLDQALVPDVSYALSPSTLGSFPSIMTSTRPLSYGGFDFGVDERPPTLATTLAEAGYRTIGITPIHWVNSFFGYRFDEEELLITPTTLSNAAKNLLKYNLADFNAGRITITDLVEASEPVLERYFASMAAYCRIRRARAPAGQRGNCRFTGIDYRWGAVQAALAEQEQLWRGDPAAFLAGAAHRSAHDEPWLRIDWKVLRAWRDLAVTGAREVMAPLCAKIAPELGRWMRPKLKEYPGADVMISRVLDAAVTHRDGPQPFFIWTHLFDAHIPYSSGSGRWWFKESQRYLEVLGHDPAIDPLTAYGPRPVTEADLRSWSATYDAAIRFLDAQIGRLRRQLEGLGLADTVIAVTSDHGEEFGEHGDTSHRYRLYEHNTRTHTFIHHPDFTRRAVPGLCTTVDLAPTIADLVGAPAPAGWEGVPYHHLCRKPRERVVFETFFGSPCDPATRPIYYACREGDFKLLWCDRADERDPLSRPGAQLFDLRLDPSEQNDISSIHSDVVARMLAPIRQRHSELIEHFDEPRQAGRSVV